MVLHAAVAVGKLKLLAGCHGNWQLSASLLGSFALKLPFAATHLPTTCSDLAVAVRLFFFRLHRIFFFAEDEDEDAGGSDHRRRRRRGRWERALRLFHQRAAGGNLRMLQHNDETFSAITMLSL